MTGTALRILGQLGVQPGQTLLISGASGRVGSAAVQIARRRGITGIGTALDLAGGGVSPDLIALTGDSARVLSIGAMGAAESGVQVSYAATNPADALAQAAQQRANSPLRVGGVGQCEGLVDVHAQQASAAGHAAGKSIVRVAGDA